MKKTITVRLMETSEPIEFTARNTYTKGRLYCIYLAGREAVVKIPMCNIFTIEEEYGSHGPK